MADVDLLHIPPLSLKHAYERVNVVDSHLGVDIQGFPEDCCRVCRVLDNLVQPGAGGGESQQGTSWEQNHHLKFDFMHMRAEMTSWQN